MSASDTDLVAPPGRAGLAEALLDELQDVVFQTDADGRWTFLNRAWEALSGHPVAAALGASCLDFVHPADRDVQRQLFAAQIAGEHEVCRQRIRYLHRDGACRWVELNARLRKDASGRVGGICGALRDITELVASEEQLRFAASVFTHAGEGIMITDERGVIVDVNRAFERITGYSAAEARGRNPNMLSSGRQPKAFYQAMWDSLRTSDYWQGEVWNRQRSGELYAERLTITAIRDQQGRQRNFVGIFSDITTQTMQAQDLERIAHYDPLTGLPNRRMLGARLQQSLAAARRHGKRVALAYLDLDGFKAVNDVHGHEYGDELLVEIGRRLREAVRECDTVCRLGGDEFVVVLDEVGDAADCLPFVIRILETVSQPVPVRQAGLHVTCSLGLALSPVNGTIEADQLLRQGDHAMYAAKTQGKNRYALFDDGQDGQSGALDADQAALAQAMRNGELELHYQPIVVLRTGVLDAAEALLRWRHPQRGLLYPAAFLQRRDGQPLARVIEDWVLDEAIAQHLRWLDAGLDIPVSVNMSGAQLHQGGFVARLRARLEAHPRLRPGCIRLEVLETSALDDIDHVAATIADCARLGVAFALDDFGTGYSSLRYLKRLPAEYIKIDRSFVQDMLDDADDRAILQGVIGMAAAFRRTTIAEGVESAAHARLLVELGCTLGQGFGIAAPMPAAGLADWVRAMPAPCS